MENKHIIIILLIVIVILAVALAYVLMPTTDAKKDCNLTIISNDTIYGGENIIVKLSDLNGTPISDAVINATLKGDNGTTHVYSAVTDENGTAKISLDKFTGNYTVNCTFAGDKNYTSNSTSQKLVIKEVVVEEPTQSQSSSTDSSSTRSSSQSSNSDDRPAVDSGGITREEADYWGWQYTPEHGGHYHGSRDAWDEKAGVYHD